MQYNIHADLKAKRSKALLSRRRRGDDRRKQLRGNVTLPGNARTRAPRRRVVAGFLCGPGKLRIGMCSLRPSTRSPPRRARALVVIERPNRVGGPPPRTVVRRWEGLK